MIRKTLFLLLTGVFLLTALPACSRKDSNKEVKQIKVMTGADQAALPGETFQQPLRVEVLGSAGKGIFGGEKEEAALENIKLRFVPLPGSDLSVEPAEIHTDAAGRVSVIVKAGKKVGDNYLRIIPVGYETKASELRMMVGAKLTGAGQEGLVGRVLHDPIAVELRKADGSPAVGVPVYFTSLDHKNKAKILTPNVTTDHHGIAKTHVQLGKKTGEYQIAVEIADPKQEFFMRFNKLSVMGIDIAAVLIGVIGGLAFFVYGMKLMSDGLQRVAGENMKKLLQFFSKNGLVAIFAGAFVTAVIQSSSATTVMVIGFINAGLLSLQQAIGIIFGANIGTTITAQIISFNLSGMALPAVAIGFVVMLSKNRIIKGWGETLLGFGLLFFGMTMMSSELKSLGTFPSFIEFFKTFDCAPVKIGGTMPILAVLGTMLIGIIGTTLVQSSSAAMGIVLALSAGGLINFYTAVPLLIGTNIGTTITAWLAALTANRVAKQAAMAHFLFNMIGALIMLILFYVPYGPERIPVFLYFINAITPGNAFAAIPQNVERHIAMAHTLFNIITVAAIFPCIGIFTRFCEILIPAKNEAERETTILEPRLLATPSIALEQSISAIRNMVSISWDMIDKAVNHHFLPVNTDPDAVRELEETEEKIDNMQTEITNYLVQITRRQLTQPQSNLIPLLMHCTNDAERIADHTDNILKLTKRLEKADIVLSDIARQDLDKIWELLRSQAENVALALAGNNQESVDLALEDERKINKLAKKYEKNYSRKEDYEAFGRLGHPEHQEQLSAHAQQQEEQINILTKQYEESHIERRNTGKCAVDASVIFIEMLWELERIGDHLANIAMRAPEIQKHYIAL
ncbi:MAG: Na/Pi symporter [Lentisphaeria bacterium]|nr:Na/Pi symporter [Lentisphaeria bacterium]